MFISLGKLPPLCKWVGGIDGNAEKKIDKGIVQWMFDGHNRFDGLLAYFHAV